MWLLIVEIGAAIIAALRGWGAKPFIFLGVTMLFGFLVGGVFGTSALGIMQLIDIILVIVLAAMALVGKKKDVGQLDNVNTTQQVAFRIKCPKCAELIMADARFCRYCGFEIARTENLDESLRGQ